MPALAALLLVTALLLGCGGEETARPAVTAEQQNVTAATAAPVPGVTASPTVLPTITPTPTPPAPLAALVNGQYVFLADYEHRVAQYEQALQAQGLDSGSADGQAALALARQEVLDGLIDGLLVEQGATALGISVADQELEERVQADITSGGGQAAFDEWLQATGQTRDDYKEMLRQSLISQQVLQTLTAALPLETEQVHARHIVVDSEELARQLLGELQQGADLTALARDYSQDLATRDNGGDLGWFPRGVVANELEAAAFGLQPGQISDVVRLGEGYHLIQVVEREANRALSPEMQVEMQQAAFARWLADLRAAASVERFVKE